ncbi:hypothetical protein NL676_034517 [Syzygium grande]|nr:hypothetical protein NL676_034517 [Syzygium grande]
MTEKAKKKASTGVLFPSLLIIRPVTAGGSSKSDAISVEQYTEDEDNDCNVQVLDSFPPKLGFRPRESGRRSPSVARR